MNVCHRKISRETEFSGDTESYADKKTDTPNTKSVRSEKLTKELLTAPRPIGAPNPVEYLHTYLEPQGKDRTVKSEILSCMTLGTLHDIADMVYLTIRDDAAVSILNYIIIEQFL